MISNSSNCIFCKILRGEQPASLAYEDESVVSFLDAAPVNRGHLLVVPKPHVRSLAELDETVSLHVFRIGMRLQRVLLADLRFEGTNLYLAEGEPATQDIPHVHLHVIPRHKGDHVEIRLPCSEIPSRDALEQVAASIRAGFQAHWGDVKTMQKGSRSSSAGYDLERTLDGDLELCQGQPSSLWQL